MQTTENSKGTGRRLRVIATILSLAAVGVFGCGAITAARPRPCTSCHSSVAFKKATEASTHANVDCAECHQSPGLTGTLLFVLRQPAHTIVTVDRPADRDAAAVPDSRCLACHEAVLKGGRVSNGLRMNHALCAQGASCTDCHSSVAHGSERQWVRSYDMDGCLSCHAKSGFIACDLCHRGRRATERVESPSFAVTHGKNWKTTHGMGNVATCTVCHRPSDCGKCHGAGVPHKPDFVATHGKYAAGPKARCRTCHAATFCDDCHGTGMPHSASFKRGHAVAARSKPALCERCHASSDCTDCHLKHIHPGGAIGKTSSAGGGRGD